MDVHEHTAPLPMAGSVHIRVEAMEPLASAVMDALVATLRRELERYRVLRDVPPPVPDLPCTSCGE